MNLIFSTLKMTVLTVMVLLLSQIQVGGKRICDHVGDMTKSSAVQKPIRVLSDNLDFSYGKAKVVKGAVKGARDGAKAAMDENEDSDHSNQ